jgi:hypothetical protein
VRRTRSRPLPNKALQLTWHSAFQTRSGSILASTLGASATVGGLCHAAERHVRWPAPARRDRFGVSLRAPSDLPRGARPLLTCFCFAARLPSVDPAGPSAFRSVPAREAESRSRLLRKRRQRPLAVRPQSLYRGRATSTGRCRSPSQPDCDHRPGRPSAGASRRAAASQGLANKRLQLTCESPARSMRGSVWRRTAGRAAGGQRLSHAAEP